MQNEKRLNQIAVDFNLMKKQVANDVAEKRNMEDYYWNISSSMKVCAY